MPGEALPGLCVHAQHKVPPHTHPAEHAAVRHVLPLPLGGGLHAAAVLPRATCQVRDDP